MQPNAPRTASSSKRAAPATAPPLSRSAVRAAEENKLYRRQRESLERRSILRGLILLAIVVFFLAS